jgi:ubiquinone/menaquinone biosynthesis C-methylase UbiE
MNNKKEFPADYYKFYEDRYRSVYEQGVDTWSGYALKNELDIFIDNTHISKGMKGIDLGCGEGRNTLYLAQKGMVMSGVDYSKAGLGKARELAKKNDLSVEYIQDDALNLSKIADKQFDFGISIGCLHMFVKQEDRNALLSQMRRVLKDNGFVFLLNLGDGENEVLTSPDQFLKIEKRRVAGDEDVYIELPNLPCWQKTWTSHLNELNENQFSVVHKFESTNLEYGKCMCVILRKNL